MTEATDYDARHRIDSHEKVCAERYGSLNQQIVGLISQIAAVHDRLNTMSNRMWALVVAAAGGALVGLSALAFYLLTRGAR